MNRKTNNKRSSTNLKEKELTNKLFFFIFLGSIIFIYTKNFQNENSFYNEQQSNNNQLSIDDGSNKTDENVSKDNSNTINQSGNDDVSNKNTNNQSENDDESNKTDENVSKDNSNTNNQSGNDDVSNKNKKKKASEKTDNYINITALILSILLFSLYIYYLIFSDQSKQNTIPTHTILLNQQQKNNQLNNKQNQLNQRKKKLDNMQNQLKGKQNYLHRNEKDLQRKRVELNQRKKQLDDMQKQLVRRKKQIQTKESNFKTLEHQPMLAWKLSDKFKGIKLDEKSGNELYNDLINDDNPDKKSGQSYPSLAEMMRKLQVDQQAVINMLDEHYRINIKNFVDEKLRSDKRLAQANNIFKDNFKKLVNNRKIIITGNKNRMLESMINLYDKFSRDFDRRLEDKLFVENTLTPFYKFSGYLKLLEQYNVEKIQDINFQYDMNNDFNIELNIYPNLTQDNFDGIESRDIVLRLLMKNSKTIKNYNNKKITFLEREFDNKTISFLNNILNYFYKFDSEEIKDPKDFFKVLYIISTRITSKSLLDKLETNIKEILSRNKEIYKQRIISFKKEHSLLGEFVDSDSDSFIDALKQNFNYNQLNLYYAEKISDKGKFFPELIPIHTRNYQIYEDIIQHLEFFLIKNYSDKNYLQFLRDYYFNPETFHQSREINKSVFYGTLDNFTKINQDRNPRFKKQQIDKKLNSMRTKYLNGSQSRTLGGLYYVFLSIDIGNMTADSYIIYYKENINSIKIVDMEVNYPSELNFLLPKALYESKSQRILIKDNMKDKVLKSYFNGMYNIKQTQQTQNSSPSSSNPNSGTPGRKQTQQTQNSSPSSSNPNSGTSGRNSFGRSQTSDQMHTYQIEKKDPRFYYILEDKIIVDFFKTRYVEVQYSRTKEENKMKLLRDTVKSTSSSSSTSTKSQKDQSSNRQSNIKDIKAGFLAEIKTRNRNDNNTLLQKDNSSSKQSKNEGGHLALLKDIHAKGNLSNKGTSSKQSSITNASEFQLSIFGEIDPGLFETKDKSNKKVLIIPETELLRNNIEMAFTQPKNLYNFYKELIQFDQTLKYKVGERPTKVGFIMEQYVSSLREEKTPIHYSLFRNRNEIENIEQILKLIYTKGQEKEIKDFIDKDIIKEQTNQIQRDLEQFMEYLNIEVTDQQVENYLITKWREISNN